jgi:DNA-binding FadR family transcriptional regulator
MKESCSTHYSERTEALRDFHRLVTAASKNSIWALIADAVGLIFADHVMSAADSSGFQPTAIADHEEIAKAIFARDSAAAGKAMRQHTERMISFYRTQMPALFSQLVEWR